MRTLVVGSGAVGGYFGARLAEAGADVHFLVRPARKKVLEKSGLTISSPHGDYSFQPKTMSSDELEANFGLVIVCVKSYQLQQAMQDFSGGVAAGTTILPLLNGVSHLRALGERFGRMQVLGGMTLITASSDGRGRIEHLLKPHELVFGELSGRMTGRVTAINELFSSAKFDARASGSILLEMWEKLTLLATNAAATAMMRGSIGDIVAAPGGRDLILRIHSEAEAVARAAGYPPRPEFSEFTKSLLTTEGSAVKASMLRDIERGSETEGEHVFGFLIENARSAGLAVSLLEAARCHLAVYGERRQQSGAVPADDPSVRLKST